MPKDKTSIKIIAKGDDVSPGTKIIGKIVIGILKALGLSVESAIETKKEGEN